MASTSDAEQSSVINHLHQADVISSSTMMATTSRRTTGGSPQTHQPTTSSLTTASATTPDTTTTQSPQVDPQPAESTSPLSAPESPAADSPEAGASSSSPAPAPFNPALSDDLVEDVNRIRGDAIGDTLYSSRFVLKTLIQLRAYIDTDGQPETDDQPATACLSENAAFERDLCTLWDMSTNTDVVKLLLEQSVLDVFTHMIRSTLDQRLCEILIGILGNMCSLDAVRNAIGSSDFIFPSLLSLVSCTDPLVLLQLMRLIAAVMVFDNNGDEEMWFRHFRQVPHFVDELAVLLSNSLHSGMLVNAIEALTAICTKFSFMDIPTSEEEGVTNFRDMFVNESLLTGLFDAFQQLLPTPAVAADDEETIAVVIDEVAAPTKRVQKMFWSFLDIQVALSQHGAHSCRVYAPHLEALFSCLSAILAPLCNPVYLFPINFNDHGLIESVNDVMQSLGDPFSVICYTQVVRIWSLIDEHRRRRGDRYKLSNTENDWMPLDADDDLDEDDNDDADFNMIDALMTVLEYLTRSTKSATVAELETCFSGLEVRAVQNLYENLRRGGGDPDIDESCAKLHQVAHKCWTIDLNDGAAVSEAEAEDQSRMDDDEDSGDAPPSNVTTTTA